MSSTTIVTTLFESATISSSGTFDVTLGGLSTLSVNSDLNITMSAYTAQSLYYLNIGNNDVVIFNTISDGLGYIDLGSGSNINFLSGSVGINSNITLSGNDNVTFTPTISSGDFNPSHLVGPGFSDFSSGDTIDLTNIPFESNGSETITYTASQNNLLIENTTTNQFFNLNFDAVSLSSGETISVKSDGLGGTEIFVTAACFALGTRIKTTLGETPVEFLQVGDQVILSHGGIAPITWIGHRHLDITRHPKPDSVRPVLITANALEVGIPNCDLFVSPDHAIYLNNHLIPAKILINGETIRQIDRPSITYYHVELSCHAVILAEDTPVESYLDTGNRSAFENGGLEIRLHPNFGQYLREHRGCAPFAEFGPIVETVRARILKHANIATTNDPELSIRYHMGAAILESRSTIPGHLTPDPRDCRRLGVKIAALTIGNQTIPINHPDLKEGWHDIEADGRWTNGYATIPQNLLLGRRVAVTVVATLAYPKNEIKGIFLRSNSAD